MFSAEVTEQVVEREPRRQQLDALLLSQQCGAADAAQDAGAVRVVGLSDGKARAVDAAQLCAALFVRSESRTMFARCCSNWNTAM